MSDNLSPNEVDRNVRRRTSHGHTRPVPQQTSSPTRGASSSAPLVSPGGETKAEDEMEVEDTENLPAWKAKLKEAVTVGEGSDEKVADWAEKMFIGDGAAMKGVLEHLKSISFTVDGKTAYKVSEAEDGSVTNLEKGWTQILGTLAKDYAYTIYIHDRRIYFLQDRHVAEFEQVRTGTIPKGKGGARETFRKLQKEDLELMKEEFNKLPEQGKKIADPQQQTTAIVALREKLAWTKLTAEEVKTLQQWFKVGKVGARKGAASGDSDKPKKLSYKDAVDSIAEVVNEIFELDEAKQIKSKDLRDPEQTKLRALLTEDSDDEVA